MKRFVSAIALACSCFAYTASTAQVYAAEQAQFANIQDPRDLFEKVTQSAFKRFKASWTEVKQEPDLLKQIIREELLPYIDHEYAAFKVLGKYVRDVNADDRKAFVDAFSDYIVTVYAQLFTQYRETQDIVVQPTNTSDDSKIAVVRSKIVEPGRPDIDVIFKLIYRNDQWRAFDMEAEGISVLSTKRKEIGAAMPRLGIDGIIKDLKQKAARKLTFKSDDSEPQS
ncbi:periplasmic phospholipid binding protein, MlaC [Catenovulum agarivorans DS-2]|uniref:Periplasmic phospholipid binding protein, MlaC n=1 Tax=Catenovulum agarivorans DS-2 TaxID=1328313 RepID=W7QMK1_9ALTE|nr:ABC transporter substrate-binding protein [Catenovulum agarivorans]EWH09138.1 periplasmic phospholipid binding protein, MlaC [Catenovulum agarivorans DS-2]